MKKTKSILWGIVLVLIGSLFAVNSFTNIDFFFDGWWTLIIIVPCAIGLISDKDKTGSLIGLLVGVFLLLCCQDLISFDLFKKLAIPAIIIIFGLKMIFSGFFNKKSNEVLSKIKEKGGSLKNISAIFSSQNIVSSYESFDGAELNAVFGGIKLDLRNAVINDDCVINAYSIFGGIDIYLPENVNVKVNSNSIFGGISNKLQNRHNDSAVTVYINGTCMFGGIDLK